MPCLVEFGPVVLVKNILEIWKFHHCISAIAFLSLLENVHVSSFKRTWIPFTQGWFMPFRFKFVNVFSLDLCLVWSTRSVEEDFSIWIFKCVFSLYCYYLLLEKGVPFHLNKLEFHLPKIGLCEVWFNIWCTGSGGKDFHIWSMNFHYFVNISP